MKSHANIIIAYVNEIEKNSGYELAKILPAEQFELISNTNPMILGKDVLAKNQLFMVINMSSKNFTENFLKEKKNFIRK